MPEPTTIYLLPGDWTMPLMASWRTFEKTLNPAFAFVLRCGKCGALTAGDGTKGPKFVNSKKATKQGHYPVIGLQCQSCGQTVKFEEPINRDAADFPVRFLEKPTTVLVLDGKPVRQPKSDPTPEGVLEILL